MLTRSFDAMGRTIWDSLTPGVARPFSAVIGLDGFVDEVVHIVDRREGPHTYARIHTLAEYGRRISQSAGLSANVEVVTVREKLGGNGAILAYALKRLGGEITYIGSVGREQVHPIFTPLGDGVELIGVAEPARTDAVEFTDGKLISSKLSPLNALDWPAIGAVVPPEELARRFDGAELISLNNWTMIPGMNDIWQGLLTEVLPRMTAPLEDKLLFIDLADPEKRSRRDLLRAMGLLERFQALGLPTVLGLNKREACQIAALYGLKTGDPKAFPLETLARFLAGQLGIHGLTIHPVDRAAYIANGIYTEVEGPLCPAPKLTTGAGDNYNAGFVYGLLNGLEPIDCLTLGVAASGYYVRQGESPNREQASAFIRRWQAGDLEC